MATVSCSGIDKLQLSLQEIANLPNEAVDAILNAQADVVVKEQKRLGKEYGVISSGDTIESIKKTTVKKTKTGRCIYVYPQGKDRDGNKNNEVAFVNNYGKRKQPARPFITDANENSETEQAEAAQEALGEWLKNKN